MSLEHKYFNFYSSLSDEEKTIFNELVIQSYEETIEHLNKIMNEKLTEKFNGYQEGRIKEMLKLEIEILNVDIDYYNKFI